MVNEKCSSCYHWNINGCAIKSTAVICQYEEKLSRQLLQDEIYEQMDCNDSEEGGDLMNKGLQQALGIMHRIGQKG